MPHKATVVDTYQITPRVKGFRLRVPGHEFEYKPGQHTTIRFESGDEQIVRPYTPTNLPGSEELALTIKRYDDGLASSYMHQKRPGDTVEIGPIEGALSLADPSRDVAFLASGTGLTPMMAMLRQYLREGTGHAHIILLLRVWGPADGRPGERPTGRAWSARRADSQRGLGGQRRRRRVTRRHDIRSPKDRSQVVRSIRPPPARPPVRNPGRFSSIIV